jgi:hypothetical protein
MRRRLALKDLRSSSGSLAMLAAMRRASSRVRRCAAERRPGSSNSDQFKILAPLRVIMVQTSRAICLTSPSP